jgi:hypothetical protein
MTVASTRPRRGATEFRFYFTRCFASTVALTTPRIIFRTSPGRAGHAATIAARSGSTSGKTVPDSVPRELETPEFPGKFEIVRGLSGPISYFPQHFPGDGLVWQYQVASTASG